MFCPEVYSEIVESGLESVDVERYLRSREGEEQPDARDLLRLLGSHRM